jgi:hypothetical protein
MLLLFRRRFGTLLPTDPTASDTMAEVECPSCGQKLSVPDELAGQPVRCSKCAGTFTASVPDAARPPINRSPDYDDDDDEFEGDIERRRSRRGAPHRAGMIMGFGVGSLALFFVSLVSGVLIGALALPVTVVGLVLGIMAWLWGKADLKKMTAGEMDASGRSSTQTGYICGMIGTILNSLGMVCGCVAAIVLIAFFGFAMSTASKMPTATPTPAPVPSSQPLKQAFDFSLARLSNYLPHRIDIIGK